MENLEEFREYMEKMMAAINAQAKELEALKNRPDNTQHEDHTQAALQQIVAQQNQINLQQLEIQRMELQNKSKHTPNRPHYTKQPMMSQLRKIEYRNKNTKRMAEAVIKKIKKSKLTENDRQSLKHALIKEFDSLRDEIAKMF